MVTQIQKFSVHSVRTITSPSDPTITTYIVHVNMRDLPNDFSLEINPRKPKMSTSVAKGIIKAVIDKENINFDINNRGIVIAAKDVKFDTSSGTLTVDMGDDETRYGILDGGHTYTAIIENRHRIPKDIDKYVKLEIIKGDTLDVAALSDARNTSAQVSDIALFELDDKFEFIKKAIQNESYANNIAYKDNDDKPISIGELIKLMFSMNIARFKDNSSAPVSTYSSKAAVFKDYKAVYDDPDNIYKKLAPQLPTLVNLYEVIQRDIPEFYKEYKKIEGKNPRFGLIRGVGASGNFLSEYNEIPLVYQVPSGFILPIFGAFRALLKLDKNTNEISWQFDPFQIWKDVGIRLVQNTFDSETNPQLAGKSKVLWQSNYDKIDGYRKDMLLRSAGIDL